MPVIHIPPALLDLTGGKHKVQVHGRTVGQALADLERMHPGTRERLFREDTLDPLIAVAVDGEVTGSGIFHPLDEDSEIHLLPVFEGG
jgi:molybdopterin converting factor small subunit